jgi:predicted RecA/RadA family phage recombinase
MATNFVQMGDAITITNTGAAITSGSGVLLGNLFGVAQTDIAATTGTGAIHTEGVWTLPKVSAQAWTVGAKIYWAAATSNCTTTAGSDKLIGVAVEVAANPSATGKVKLCGVSQT